MKHTLIVLAIFLVYLSLFSRTVPTEEFKNTDLKNLNSSIFPNNIENPKLIYKIKSIADNDSLEFDYRYWYDRDSSGVILSFLTQSYRFGDFQSDRLYNCEYFTDYFQFEFHDSHAYKSESKPDINFVWFYSDQYDYNLNGDILKHSNNEGIHFVSDSYIEQETTEQIYTYDDNKLNSVFDHYIYDKSKEHSETGYITFYYYDDYGRINQLNYHEYYSNELLERTNWIYNDTTATSIKEIKDAYGIWNPVLQKEYYFDVNNNLIKEERYNRVADNWIQYESDSLYYYNHNIIKTIVTYDYNTGTSQYLQKQKIDYIYRITISTPEVNLKPSGIHMNVYWASVLYATSYIVYSSNNPYAQFPEEWTLEVSNVTQTIWTDTKTRSNKKFYKVVAIREDQE